MRVRALDSSGDWTFGKGQNDYKVNAHALAQNIQTRLSSFLGDCFFDLGAGIDWFNFLGSKDRLTLNLSISATIMKTESVTGINQLFVDLNHVTRKLTIQYKVQSIYSVVSGIYQYDLNGIG